MKKRILSLTLIAMMLIGMFQVMTVGAYAGEQSIDLSDANATVHGEWRNMSKEYRGGIGGKAIDDEAYCIDINSDTSVSSGRYQIDADYTPGTQAFSCEFSVYADGDVSAWFGYAAGYTLGTWNADGTFTFNGGSINLERGMWHRIVITHKLNKQRHIWVDGVLCGNQKGWDSANGSLFIGFSSGTNGTVAFDDVVKYVSTADVKSNDLSDDIISPTNSSTVIYDTDKKSLVITSIEYTDVEDLKNKLLSTSGAKAVRLYTDESLAEEVNVLTECNNAVAVFDTVNGQGIDYYTIVDEITLGSLGIGIKSDLSDAAETQINILDNKSIGFYGCAVSGPEMQAAGVMNSSEDLLAALDSTKGYTLKYVDVNKKEAYVKLVTDGYILAEKGEEQWYIPVVSKGEDNITKLVDAQYSGTGDESWKLGITEETVDGKLCQTMKCDVSGYNNGRYTLPIDDYTHIFTYEFDLYVPTGKVNAYIAYGSTNMIKLCSDGNIDCIPSTGTGSLQKINAVYDTGVWNRIAITYNAPKTKQYDLYINGQYIATGSALSLNHINLGYEETVTEDTVGLSVSNMNWYYGYYDNDMLDSKVEFKEDADYIYATATIKEALPANANLYFAKYDESGNLLGIEVVPMTAGLTDIEAKFNNEYAEPYNYKAFLWKVDLTPVVMDIFNY